jgi:hypothetical protein
VLARALSAGNADCSPGALVNRLPQPEPVRPGMVPFDPLRHVLQERIERAKSSLFEDLDRLSAELKQTASTTAKSFFVAAIAGAVVLAGVVSLVLVRRQRRRLRIVWR